MLPNHAAGRLGPSSPSRHLVCASCLILYIVTVFCAQSLQLSSRMPDSGGMLMTFVAITYSNKELGGHQV